MEDCIFCKIVAGTIFSRKVFEDNWTFAFHDVQPQTPTHVLIIPKQHFFNLEALADADQLLLGHLMHTVTIIAKQEHLSKEGYRVAINCGSWGGQLVQHLHIHLLGGRKLTDGLG